MPNRYQSVTTLSQSRATLGAMDIDALHSALVSLTVLSEKLHAAGEELSEAQGAVPFDFGILLGGIERDLRTAKASLALELGFDVCGCCWPPELLVKSATGELRCPSRELIRSSSQRRVRVPAHRARSAR